MPPVGSYCLWGSEVFRSNDLSITSVLLAFALRCVAVAAVAATAATSTARTTAARTIDRLGDLIFVLLLVDDGGLAGWTTGLDRDELLLEGAASESRVRELFERVVGGTAEDCAGDAPADGRGEHEAVPAEACGEVEAGEALHGAEDGLVVGRHVVEARDEDRERDVGQLRQQVARHRSDLA